MRRPEDRPRAAPTDRDPDGKWPPWKTWSFAIVSSLLLWAIIIFVVLLLI